MCMLDSDTLGFGIICLCRACRTTEALNMCVLAYRDNESQPQKPE